MNRSPYQVLQKPIVTEKSLGDFAPAPSALKTQKTCGQRCRLSRRAKHEAVRREADLPSARWTERARKRRQRERQAGTGPRMSRAGLSAQASAAIEEIVDKLGHA